MADTRDTLLTGEEFEALNALGASERVGRKASCIAHIPRVVGDLLS